MSEQTENLNLPLIAAAQAQKHITHNEALLALDTLVQTTALTNRFTSPPTDAANGASYIVAAGASGDWANKDHMLAVWRDGIWQFHQPQIGWRIWLQSDNQLYVFDGTAWQVFESGLSGADLATGSANKIGVNAGADDYNRLTVKSDAILFSHDDVTPGSGSIRSTLNKATTNDTASHLFQNNYSGRAEFGLTGDDNFHLKVSPDGSAWQDAMQVDRIDGVANFPNGVKLQSGNTLMHYEAGSFTPALTAQTPGDLTVSYSSRQGTYSCIDDLVIFDFRISGFKPVYSTASGGIIISGLPFMVGATAIGMAGLRYMNSAISFPAGYTMLTGVPMGGSNILRLYVHGSGLGSTWLGITSIPSGRSCSLHFNGSYRR